MDQKEVVRLGYDAIAGVYLSTRAVLGEDTRLLADLMQRLPDGARVLDAGCGAGVPVARLLSTRFNVTGVDISPAQIALAREHVPNARFICQDITTLDATDGSFDAICSFYTIIHIPREEHAALLRSFRRMLVPGGFLLASLGANDNPHDVEDDWLGAGAAMSWSHFDRETNLRLLREAGFEIIWDTLVTEDDAFGGGKHLFVLAMRSEE